MTKHTKSYLIAWTCNVSYLNLKYQKSVTISCDWSIVALVTDRAWCERRITESAEDTEYMSSIMRKLSFSIKHMLKERHRSDYSAADQPFCFCYLDSTIPLLPKSEISSLLTSSVVVQLRNFKPFDIFCGCTAQKFQAF